MAVKLSRKQCQCFAFSNHRQREISYKSVSHMSKAGRKGMSGMAMAKPNFCEIQYSTAPRSHTSKGLAIIMHVHSDLIEPRSLVTTGEHGIL